MVDLGFLWGAGVTGVGALVWLLRLEGRVNTNEALHKALESTTEASFTQLKTDVQYIRERIDEALR